MTKNTKRRFTFRIPEELHNKVRERALELGVSTNALIVQILWQHFKQTKKN